MFTINIAFSFAALLLCICVSANGPSFWDTSMAPNPELRMECVSAEEFRIHRDRYRNGQNSFDENDCPVAIARFWNDPYIREEKQRQLQFFSRGSQPLRPDVHSMVSTPRFWTHKTCTVAIVAYRHWYTKDLVTLANHPPPDLAPWWSEFFPASQYTSFSMIHKRLTDLWQYCGPVNHIDARDDHLGMNHTNARPRLQKRFKSAVGHAEIPWGTHVIGPAIGVFIMATDSDVHQALAPHFEPLFPGQ